VADRLKTYEVESLAQSMAMAPLSQDSVARLLRSHGELSHDWAEIEGPLQGLSPAWAELQSLLNELNALMARSAMPERESVLPGGCVAAARRSTAVPIGALGIRVLTAVGDRSSTGGSNSSTGRKAELDDLSDQLRPVL
jgi:hypothetical protein